MNTRKNEATRNSITVCAHGTISIHIGQTSIHMSREEFLAFSRAAGEMALRIRELHEHAHPLRPFKNENVH